MSTRHTIGLALVLATLLPVAAQAGSSDQYPRTGQEARDTYERDPDTWLKGPVQYIALDEERDAFKALTTTTQRARFIRRFWERRDHDLRDRNNPYRIEFYDRVAHANRRYHEYPRGWKSDRGLIHIVLGRPDHVREGPGGQGAVKTWTYYTIGPRGNERPFGSLFGEIKVYFVATRGRDRYEIFGDFGGPGHFPRYVREILDFSRLAAVDPSLTRRIVD